MNKIEQAIATILSTSLSDSQKQQALLLVCSINQNEHLQTKQDFIEIPSKDYSTVGFIYLIKNFDNGQVKIGFSNNPQHRVKEIQTGCHSAKLVFFAKGTMDEEKYLHEIYSEKRIKNEWFSLSNADIKEIQEYLLEERNFIYKKGGAGRGLDDLEPVYRVLVDAIKDQSFFRSERVVGVNSIKRVCKVGTAKAQVLMTMLGERGVDIIKK